MMKNINLKNVGWVVPAGIILFAASIIAMLICGKVDNIITAGEVCIAIIVGGLLLVYANKDLKDRIIPVKWWIVPVILGCVNLAIHSLTVTATINTVISSLCVCIPVVIVFLLGFFRKINGADSLGIMTVLMTLSPFVFHGSNTVSMGWVAVITSFILALLLMVINQDWKKNGIPYLVPLVLSYAVFGVFI